MLIAISGGWFLVLGVRHVYPVLLPHLRNEYGLDLTTAGLLMTVLFFAYALGQLPSGILSDQLGKGVTMTVSMVASAGALALVVLARTAPVLFGATALFGFGTALFTVARFTSLADLYPEQIGIALGVTEAVGEVGSSVLPPLAGVVAVVVAWQYGFGITIPLFLLAGTGIWLTVPSRTTDSTSASYTVSFENGRYLLSVLGRPAILYGTAVLLVGMWILNGFGGFYPTYLIEVKGLSPQTASALFGLFFAVGIVVHLLSGKAYDVFGVRRSLASVILVSGVALALLPLTDGSVPLAGLTVLLSSLVGFISITVAYLTTALPEDVRGTGYGILQSIAAMLASASTVVLGASADRGLFDEAFLGLAALTGVMLVIAIRLPVE